MTSTNNYDAVRTDPIAGELILQTYEGENGRVVCLYGTPDGLKSLAQKLIQLADIDQKSIPTGNLPNEEGLHVHIGKPHGLDAKSLDLDLGRMDDKQSGSTDWYKRSFD